MTGTVGNDKAVPGMRFESDPMPGSTEVGTAPESGSVGIGRPTEERSPLGTPPTMLGNTFEGRPPGRPPRLLGLTGIPGGSVGSVLGAPGTAEDTGSPIEGNVNPGKPPELGSGKPETGIPASEVRGRSEPGSSEPDGSEPGWETGRLGTGKLGESGNPGSDKLGTGKLFNGAPEGGMPASEVVGSAKLGSGTPGSD